MSIGDTRNVGIPYWLLLVLVRDELESRKREIHGDFNYDWTEEVPPPPRECDCCKE